jgi:16S rRNA (guanine(1405)-N(7))-methyltransferase
MDKTDKELRGLIIRKVKEKRELFGLEDSFIDKELAFFIAQNKKLYLKLRDKFESNNDKSIKSKEFKKILKGVRSKLREIFGVFYLGGFESTEELIKSITKENVETIAFDILKLHRSSKERLRNYEEIYDNIYRITKIQPEIILDLASGYNAFSYFFLKESFQCSPNYTCCDIGKKDVILINKFFQNADIKGNAFYVDLTTDLSEIKRINADICFLFKALDSLEATSKYISEKILKEINSKFIVISFPTKSLGGGRSFFSTKRKWVDKLMKRLNYTYEEFSIPNEMFFVIKKE